MGSRIQEAALRESTMRLMNEAVKFRLIAIIILRARMNCGNREANCSVPRRPHILERRHCTAN